MLRLDLPDRPEDWADCHDGALVPSGTSARVAFERGLAAAPSWMGSAMALRNIVVAPFGLVTGTGKPTEGADFLAQMPVIEDSPELFETGMTDKHLTFTLRVEAETDTVAVRTRIWFHSGLGRAYLKVVLPAHNLILRKMVRSLGEPV